MSGTGEHWREPAGDAPWRREFVHVWLAAWDGDVAAPDLPITAAERERASRFLFERDRVRFVRSHAALRAVLSRYTGIEPRCVPLRAAEGGKPEFEPGCGSGWRFNLSHSGEAALVAVAHAREVGVDIERVRPMENGPAMAARFFAPAECAALGRVPAESYDAAFFACWTRKEAFIKATGEGLRRGLATFTVPVDAGEAGPWRVDGWSLISLPAPEGYAAAMAVEGEAGPVRCWRLAL